MAKKSEMHQKTINIAVVGLSGSEKEKGSTGIGKSCLCNRFVKPLADDYYVDHISVLSQTDFSGRVVNNEHWLYWGETSKITDEGIELQFSIIEQTEFIDDSCFQPFKSGKTEPYFKRCAATRLCSAEKLMYICKNQLGIEKEYEQKYLPDGRFNVDGFVCVFDVSEVPGRTLDKAIEYTAVILNNLIKTKKPVVLATTKHDECIEFYVREVEKLVNRKEYKGSIPFFETSAHENVNVDLPFIACAQMLDRARGKAKTTPYFDSLRSRKEVLDCATDAYQILIRNQVTDYRALWNSAYKKLSQNHEFHNYCDLFGQNAAYTTFNRHLRKLKEEYVARKMQMYIRVLPELFADLLPDLESIGENDDWDSVKGRLRNHEEFDNYFVFNADQTWQEADLGENPENRIPFDLLDTQEAEQCFLDHRSNLESEERRKDMRVEFKHLLQETGYVSPGKSFNEVRVLFMGRDCYESLSEQDLQEIYSEHQRDITERAKLNFQELLLEHSELFYHYASLGPGSVITQDDIFKITEAMQEDFRYKALDRLEQDRTLMLLRHLGFIHGPIREHCPAFPNCMDLLIEKSLSAKARRSSFARNTQWFSDSESNHLNIVLLGSGGLGEELATAVKRVNQSFEMDKVRYTLDFRIIDGDVDLPQNSFRTTDFVPQGCFCVYSNHQTLEYVRDSFEKTLLSNLEQEDRLPFHGLPIVLLFAADSNINEKDIIFLREEGQNRAKSLQCPFMDVTNLDVSAGTRFDEECLSGALKALVENIQRRVGLIQIYQSLPQQSLNPDLSILMCLFCGDAYTVDLVMSPFYCHQQCFVTAQDAITLHMIVCEQKRYIKVIITSYHGAHAFRDELLHGFILVYSAKRKASLATLSAFTNNIPNTPTQILAVCDGNSNIHDSNQDLSHHLITEGNTIAEKLQAHFASVSGFQQKTNFMDEFLTEALDRKPQIEKAFEMDDSDYSLERRTPLPPPVPSRQESFNIHSGSVDDGADSEGIYEQLPSDRRSDNEDPQSPINNYGERVPLSPSDDSEIYASVFSKENGGEHLLKPSQIKNRRSLQTDLYRQSFASSESLDRPLPPLPKEPPSEPLPSLPPRHDTAFAPPPYTRTASPPPSYLNHFSPRVPLHHRPLPTLSSMISNSSRPSASLYATGRRRSSALASDKSFASLHDYHVKKSNSLKSGSICPATISSRHGSRDYNYFPQGYGAYPPPPEPAPPDYPSSRLRKAPSLPTSGNLPVQRSFDEADGSPQEVITRDSVAWAENRSYERNMRPSAEWLDNEMYHAYQTGGQKMPPPIKPKPGKLKPGKLNIKQYDNITSAVGRLSLKPKLPLSKVHAPLATPETADLPPEYTQNSMSESKIPKIRSHKNKDVLVDKGIYAGNTSQAAKKTAMFDTQCGVNRSDSDSDWSSMERRQRDPYNRVSRKQTPHKKVRRKRGIPVAPPKLPSFESGPQFTASHYSSGSSSSTTTHQKALNASNNTVGLLEQDSLLSFFPLTTLSARADHSGSDMSNEDETADLGINPSVAEQHSKGKKRSFQLRRRTKPLQSHSVPDTNLSSPHSPPNNRVSESAFCPESQLSYSASSSKLRIETLSCLQAVNDDDYELSSPREAAMRQLETVLKSKSSSFINESDKVSKKEKKKSPQYGPSLEEFIQSESNSTPLFVEKCIHFIEEEGLDSEGIYRVPGNRAHVDLLFQKFDEDPNVSIKELDIPVNAVATALKDFFSKRLPPLIPPQLMDELTDVAGNVHDRNMRLVALSNLLRKLPSINFEVLKFVFHHFVRYAVWFEMSLTYYIYRVTENSRLNSMDSKNLAICWWPTLLPFEFNDMLMFERMRPHLEQFVQTMIDQFQFLFCDQQRALIL
ncbi:rho GTPase-activating protein 190-like protein [Leptotrombidium deliense]|uniref:Rho GTPase-activating protein 190-like protein n=1 Tax=Leptotrombidium deliense TaxID=299467 RepID=A0A443SVQ9_9ACAR|nr:rho GTPase-activating protein 190-like protein [Leptotrombidium deliense]